jgi:hypothetical protein
MIDPGPPKRVVAEVCIPAKDGGEICATAVEPLHGNGRSWVDCRARARNLAKAARAGEDGVAICERCGTNVIVQHGGDTLLCPDCRSETTEEREMERAFEPDREGLRE